MKYLIGTRIIYSQHFNEVLTMVSTKHNIRRKVHKNDNIAFINS